MKKIIFTILVILLVVGSFFIGKNFDKNDMGKNNNSNKTTTEEDNSLSRNTYNYDLSNRKNVQILSNDRLKIIVNTDGSVILDSVFFTENIEKETPITLNISNVLAVYEVGGGHDATSLGYAFLLVDGSMKGFNYYDFISTGKIELEDMNYKNIVSIYQSETNHTEMLGGYPFTYGVDIDGNEYIIDPPVNKNN